MFEVTIKHPDKGEYTVMAKEFILLSVNGNKIDHKCALGKDNMRLFERIINLFIKKNIIKRMK